jgi:hypothetical protein
MSFKNLFNIVKQWKQIPIALTHVNIVITPKINTNKIATLK